MYNEEGKYNSQAPNRALVYNGRILDTIYDSFFIAGIKRDNFVGIPVKLVQKYTEMFPKSRFRIHSESAEFQLTMSRYGDKV